MEVFMRSIAFTANENDIKKGFANVLHSPRYASLAGGPPLNFNIHLFHQHGSTGPHKGCGVLTIPNQLVARRLLQDYGPSGAFQVVVRGRPILLSESRSAPRPDIIHGLLRTPYQDPTVWDRQKERERQLSQNVIVEHIQFGWYCRDGAFSVEWEAQPGHTKSQLTFHDETRELAIKLANSDILSLHTTSVIIRFSNIDSISFGGDTRRPCLIFSLQVTPAFEIRQGEMLEALIMAHQPRANNCKPRKRTSSLDGNHERVVSFVSNTLRLTLGSYGDLDDFRKMARIAGLPKIHASDPPVVYRGLFSKRNIDRLETWIATLPWKIAFQLLSIYRNQMVDPVELYSLRGEVTRLASTLDSHRASEALRLFGVRLRSLWADYENEGVMPQDNSVPLCLTLAEREATAAHSALRQKSSDGLFECYHVTFTPTSMFLEGPYPDQSNRVLRQFPEHQDNFLRVNFTDEDKLLFRWDRDVDGAAFVRERVGGIFQKGFDLAGKHFDFLAYSSSALKEHAVWFCTPFDHPTRGRVTAETIRQSLGNFDRVIYCPARYGARMSQAFSATDPSIVLEAEEIIYLRDIERNGSVFTDGIGTISREMADDIWSALGKLQKGKRPRYRRQAIPSAYQIRIGGYKGMLSVDYKMKEPTLCVRPSMDKFDAPNSRDIEIARAFDKPGPMYLNRPLIMILDTLGVPTHVFSRLQKIAVEDTKAAVGQLERAARLLEQHGLGTSFRLPSVMLNLYKEGFGFDENSNFTLADEFLQQSLHFGVNHILRELKHRARIPVKDCWTLVGIADVHDFLEEGEIFACIKELGQKSKYLEGPIMISRSPTMHPGDVQIVRAIGKPPPNSPFVHDEFPNCVVFSCKGQRSLPSCLGGGDLDGDLYNLVTLKDLHPPRRAKPAGYKAPELKTLDRPCTITDVADFVVEFINSDILGMIANQHLIIADQSERGVEDPDCILLAGLHSDAVDYPKTGRPVEQSMLPKLKFREKPDWSAGEMSYRSPGQHYQSQRALGHLYRAIEIKQDARPVDTQQVKRVCIEEALALVSSTYAVQRNHPVSALLRRLLRKYNLDVEWPVEIAAELTEQFLAFSTELQCICAMHTLSRSKSKQLSEEEVFIGSIMARSSQPRRRQDMISHMRTQSTELVTRVRAALAGEEEGEAEDWLLRAWVAWEISRELDDNFGAKSFGWVALGAFFEAAKEIDEREFEHRKI
ncbi:hypothetical protein BOTBODRAFT_124037 [Botryobasidium botryosum FD-172 SS1]|uniref:RNA-dependent RNA polymerase n=1 Tax=Botryobasidium botryosum (strain FD-172 SS1) TaxID=930990 RepID=A0A067N0H1_BOTB1|nr:hypothetical protein BOTBODRAFT_124037 [Botryobasidium botryosum FD-172 SS1]